MPESQIAIIEGNVPLVGTKSLSKGYFEGLPNFVWGDVKDKDEVGKGSFGSVMKGCYIPDGRVVVVKRFFGFVFRIIHRTKNFRQLPHVRGSACGTQGH